jgi:hypothetical protein
MSYGARGARVGRLLLGLFVVLAGLLPVHPTSAQVQQGATLTILRGQVAIIHADGSAVQPAASGSTVNVGDEIRTISKSGALITFFSGTEIEMGEDTILVVNQLSRNGDKIDVSLRQVLGATINRVQTIAGTGSTYQIEAGGAVALVRGTTFALVGPVTTSAGDVVTIACLSDCTPASTFAGCSLAPFLGYGVTTSKGKVDSGCVSYAVGRSEGLVDAASQAVTTMEQHFQSDSKDPPPGQNPAGQRQENAAHSDSQDDKDDKQNQDEQRATVTPTPTPVPGGPGTTPCNAQTTSGGAGVTTNTHALGATSGTFTFTYDAFSVPDRFQIVYEGQALLDTGFVSGSSSRSISFSGSSSTVTVTVTGSAPGTAWNYTVGCAAPAS